MRPRPGGAFKSSNRIANRRGNRILNQIRTAYFTHVGRASRSTWAQWKQTKQKDYLSLYCTWVVLTSHHHKQKVKNVQSEKSEKSQNAKLIYLYFTNRDLCLDSEIFWLAVASIWCHSSGVGFPCRMLRCCSTAARYYNKDYFICKRTESADWGRLEEAWAQGPVRGQLVFIKDNWIHSRHVMAITFDHLIN